MSLPHPKTLARVLSLACPLLALAFASPCRARIDPALVPAAYSQPAISPDGKFVAFSVLNEDGRRVVLVIDCTSKKPGTLTVVDKNVDPKWAQKNVTSFAWVGGHDLVLTSDLVEGANTLHTANAEKTYVSPGRSDARYSFISAVPGTSQFLVAAAPAGDKPGPRRVLQLSTENIDKETEVFSCETKAFECVADRAGELRLVKHDNSAGAPAWFARNPADNSWKELQLPSWVRVFGFDYRNDLIVVGGTFNAPNPGIHYYSVAEDRYVHSVVTNASYAADQVATPLFNDAQHALVGLHFDGDRPLTSWVAPEFQRLQKSFDTAFTGSRNRIVAWDATLAWMLVERIYGDRPSEFCLVDNVGAKVTPLCTNGGQVDPAHTATTDFFSFSNRAGVKLGGYLTRPQGTTKPLPLVIMIANEPFNRKNDYGWDSQAQFLATKGFATARVNFRGTGQLTDGARLDWKDKADATKPFEDIADAIAFLAKEHGIDDRRVAIVGFGGAGGWMAIYAPIALPKTFRCAAALGGIYSLDDYRNSSGSHPLRDFGWLPFADESSGLSATELAEFDPAHNAERLTVPVFLGYGEYSPDGYVKQVDAFAREAKRAGVPLEKTYIGSFYLASLDNQKILEEYFKTLTAFLQKRL